MTKMWQEIFEQPDVLANCMSNSVEQITEIIKSIKKNEINNVVIAARGTSDHAAIYAKYIIEYLLGIPVVLAAPSIITVYNKKLKFTNSLVIGISQSGKAQDVLEVLNAANNQETLTISITNNSSSQLAKNAKFHLFTNAGKEESVAATKTFTSQMMMIAILAANWADDEKLIKDLKLIPSGLRKVLKLGDYIKTKAERYRYMEDCFVLSRGINYSAALECSLKIQETTYVRAKGYAISDFHHGPFAMIEDNTPVIVFAPEGPTSKDTYEMLEKLKKAKAEIILVTNIEELLERDYITFEIPKTSNDIISSFYNVVWSQMFACSLATTKGLNPDKPRGLNKVTITR